MRLFHPLTAAMAAAVLVLVASGSALASQSGSLLSGYSGPGGGEQSVLGSKLLPAKHGSGGIRAPAQAVTQPAPPAPPAPTTTAATAPVKPHHHATTTTTPAPTTAATPTIATATVTPRPRIPLPVQPAAVVIAYPAASSSGAGLPLSGSTLPAIVLGLLLLTGTALATRNLARPAG